MRAGVYCPHLWAQLVGICSYIFFAIVPTPWMLQIAEFECYITEVANSFKPHFLNRRISQIPQCIRRISHSAPFCNRNVHCGIWYWYIVGFVQVSRSIIIKYRWMDSDDFTVIQASLIFAWSISTWQCIQASVWEGRTKIITPTHKRYHIHHTTSHWLCYGYFQEIDLYQNCNSLIGWKHWVDEIVMNCSDLE